MSVSPIPEGYSAITPYLVLADVRAFLSFVQEAFGAAVTFEMEDGDGAIKHAQFKIGDAMVMVGEAPGAEDAMPSSLYLYVEDCDAVFAQALGCGATAIMACEDMFYGDRHGGIMDPLSLIHI